MRKWAVLFLLFSFIQFGWAEEAKSEDETLVVEVLDAYIEMHTGAGRGYPIFYVISRGELIEILLRHTDWFKVRTTNGKEGWVSRAQMVQTLNPSGERLKIKDAAHEDFVARDWEVGVIGGNFEGAPVISVYSAYHFTENISVEGSFSQVLGNLSSSTVFAVHLVHQPFPEWKISPYFLLGTGYIDTSPKATIAAAQDRQDQFAHYGLGARMHLTKRLLIRIDYRNYVIFSSRNDNEEIEEWKIGFGFFF